MTLLDSAVWTAKISVGGWTDGGGAPLTVRDAATGAAIGEVGAATPAQVAEAATRAAAAQKHWAALMPAARAAVMRRAGDLFEQNADEIAAWIVRESGGTWLKARSEVLAAAAECREAAALPSHPNGEVIPSNKPRWSFSRRLPVGVVTVIAPFNYPLTLAIRSVAPALGLGNAVLLKPDPRTSVGGGVAIQRVFDEAGLPAGVLQTLTGGAEVGIAAVEAPEVRVISFTGSTAAGRRVGETAARLLKRAHLELGGNNAIVVLPGADVERAAASGAYGSFLHQGQICQSAGRHLVHEAQHDEYVAALARIADSLRVADPYTDHDAQMGPIIDDGQFSAVCGIVDSAVGEGAEVVTGGPSGQRFFRPTVLRGMTPDMLAWREEIFGPVAPVLAYRTLDEAVDLVNASEYGLSVSLLGDVGTAISVADRIVSGKVHINDQTVNDEANIPFGGVGASGNGARFGGATANLEAFTETQWLTVRAEMEANPWPVPVR
ncbi:aldehyde dehydrogenase family protein [Microbacterium gallinarum]|uniref:Aldehyde dehydrogenase family protein n=1 Tax=Microbacterium gallinarum TaxID=2762209 RepID=A0ABR8X0F7_9MICO|nr:aldehyde dehydrogenase family protein [Microbacterium gallinarum]MBD8022734.1 aldehyde dehydrogenase family protein [Microbacterium gallinarum]